jgi:hypothetical protein
MCTDQTRQEYVFLQAFGDGSDTLIEPEIRINMRQLSSEIFGTKYYENSPDILPKLIEAADIEHFIKPASPVAWRITPDGIAWRDFKFRRFVQPALMQHGF